MANVVTNGYFVTSLNNVKVRLYPQVLGIHKIHEHNLCNALRDFGLMLKSDSRYQLLQYNYDFLKFVHLMRSSEICMISHGFSSLNLRDMNWWEQFIKISSEAIYDMDGKEIGGFLYSLSKVYNKKNYLIDKLFDESVSWLNMFNSLSVSLLIKSAAHFKCNREIIKGLNSRVIEMADNMNVIDIVFFLTSNVDSRTHNISLFRMMALKLIEKHKEIELHQLRAIAYCISVSGFKSHIFFNILTLRLKEIYKTKKLSDTDIVSLLLSFTTQRFLHHNDLCIDKKIYENFLKENPTISDNIYTYPLPELGPIFAESLSYNRNKLQAHGLPIVIRGISILNVPINEELKEFIINKIIKYMDEDYFGEMKITNLVVSFARYSPNYSKCWDSVLGTLTRQKDLQISGEMLTKMINTIGNIPNFDKSKSDSLSKVYDLLIQKCKETNESIGSKPTMSVNRLLSLNLNNDLLISDDYLDSINKNVDQFTKSYIVKVLKSYIDCYDNIKSKDKFLKFLKAVEDKLDEYFDDNYNDSEIKQLINMYINKLNK